MRLTSLLSALFLLLTLTLARPWNISDECPTSIDTVISSDPCSYGHDYYGCTNEPRFSSMQTVHNALLHCHNITALDLRVTLLGCSEWPDRFNFPFDVFGGEMYPRLTSLRLEGYRFDHDASRREAWRLPEWTKYKSLLSPLDVHTWCSHMWRWLRDGHWKTWEQWKRLSAAQREKSNLGLWLDAMDWSGIEELMIVDNYPDDEVLEKLPSRLPALKKLEMTNTSFITALPNNTLTHFTWIGSSRTTDLPSILAHQGKSLQSLEFRCPELECTSFPAIFDLAILPNMTHNLTYLSLNIPRNGTWPLESLQTVASLPHLRSAHLWMNLQSPCRQQRPDDYTSEQLAWEHEYGKDYCTGKEQFQEPFVDKAAAEELFTYMRDQNPSGNLSSITFWVGDWSRPWDGPLSFPPWLEGRRAKIVCTAGEELNGDGWCMVETDERYCESDNLYDEWE